jgi:hypothetical protein
LKHADLESLRRRHRRKRLYRALWRNLLLWSLCILAGYWLARRNVF